MEFIIYYHNLDYDQLPTARKKQRLDPSNAPITQNLNHQYNNQYHSNGNSTTTNSNQYNNRSSESNGYPTNVRIIYPVASCDSSDGCSQNDLPSSLSPNLNEKQFNNSFSTFRSTLKEPNKNSNSNGFAKKIYKNVDQKELLLNLRKYFKFDSFRENQQEAINATCQGLDTLVLMPTGGGKSICYQLPAIVSEGLTIVISPLKSLIEDQVSRLKSLKIETAALLGETSDSDASQILSDLRSPAPTLKLLYVTPEKVNNSGYLLSLFMGLYSNNMLARFVVDEAHCVSCWGPDFRPDFRKLGILRERFPNVPIMALTATAPPEVRDDIFVQLKMNKKTGVTLIQSFNRPNLRFIVKSKGKNCIDEICKSLTTEFKKNCGIIYCLSRKDCETMSEKIRERGIFSAPYHAGLSDTQRRKVFNKWSDGTFQVVCATIAFGMGIDKSNVRFVIHYSVPKSIEGYYQEAGRAGRDGQMATCILYYSKSDVYRMKGMLSRGMGRQPKDKQRDIVNLDSVVAYGENKRDCRREILLKYLGEHFDRDKCIDQLTTACDNCRTLIT